MPKTHQFVSAAAVVLAALVAGCAELPSRRPASGEEPYTRNVAGDERPQLALVLSGGSLRGFAHLGVLKVLEANGIRPDLIVGTSAGSIAGGLYASGVRAAELLDAARSVDFDLGSAWLGGGSPVYTLLEANLATARIEAFPIRFAAVAADLQRGCLAVFNAGSAAIAVQASAAVPGVFAPTRIGERDYADGGLVSPLPVRVARSLGAAKVIAVNVIFDPKESRLGSVIDRLFQTALVMSRTLALAESNEADLVIEPALPPEAKVTLANRAALIEAGERAAIAALPQIRALLAAPARPVIPRRDSRQCTELGALQTAALD